MKKLNSLVILVPLGLIGCGSSPSAPVAAKPTAPVAKVTAENQRSLFPFTEGNTWDFDVEAQIEAPNQPKQVRTTVIQYKVKKVVKGSDGSDRATIVVFQDGKSQDEQEWLTNSKGIFQVSMKASKIAYNPMQPVIRFPVKDQDEFKWTGSGFTPIGKMGTMTYAFKNDGIQESVDTEMGSMSALFMQTGGSFKTNDGVTGQIVVNSWFSPGVGLIRYRQVIGLKGVNSSITLRLKSYNVKK